MSESEWEAVRAIGVRQGTQPRLGKVAARLELSPLPDPEWIAIFNDKSNSTMPWVDNLPPPRVTDGEIAFNGVRETTSPPTSLRSKRESRARMRCTATRCSRVAFVQPPTRSRRANMTQSCALRFSNC